VHLVARKNPAKDLIETYAIKVINKQEVIEQEMQENII